MIKRLLETNKIALHASRLVAAGYLVLIAVTWPLWIPQSGFPQVPLISIAHTVPMRIEWNLLVALLTSLVGICFLQNLPIRKCASLLAFASTLGLVCIDQHRLQPWAWEFAVLSLVSSISDERTTRRVWRWLVIGLYGWSAWSKMDYGFCVQHGPFLLDGLCKSLGFTRGTQGWPALIRFGAAAVIPVFELSVALGLALPRTRRFGVVGAVVMHVMLLLALGPFGHGHRPGVLTWNLFFLLQNWMLFRRDSVETVDTSRREFDSHRDEAEVNLRVNVPQKQATAREAKNNSVTGSRDSPSSVSRTGNALARTIVVAVLVWPVLEPFGLCDHWTAWAVYAAKPERTTLYIAETDLEKLPEYLRQYLGQQAVPDEWHPLLIDRWSLDAVLAPIYPQDRFHVGVALALVRTWELQQIRIVIEGPANRWTQQRTVHEYLGKEAIERLAGTFRCNAFPR